MGNHQDIPSQEKKKESFHSKGKSQLSVKTFTWSRDSHDLFDYEGKNFSKKNIKTHRPGIITRNKEDIRMIKDNGKQLHEEEKEILRLTVHDGNFWINSIQDVEDDKRNKEGMNLDEIRDTSDNGLWIVVKSIKTSHNGGFQLNEGDFIKLGRIKFRVKEIQGSPVDFSQKPRQTEIDNDPSLDGSMIKSQDSIKISPRGGNQTCRICLSESSEPGNPFFNPCRCSGTMKYVHIKCLQRWLKSKLHIKDSGQSIAIYWKTLECELCKTSYPNSFLINNQKYDIVEIDRPNCAYLMMEVLSKERNMARGLHIIKMENKTNIRLGRGHDSDIRITDISVSRCHAIIKLYKGKFYLEDNNSKFGTLINMKKSFPISGAFRNVSLQAGRTLICVTLKKSKTIFPVCFSHNANADSSNDEANSDGEDRVDTEHVPPSRQSQNSNMNRNLDRADENEYANDENPRDENAEGDQGVEEREDNNEQDIENQNI